MTSTILKPGDKVRLNDAGIDVVANFIRSRADTQKSLGLLMVESAFKVPVTDDSGQPIKNFQSVTLVEFPDPTLDNTQMEKVS